MLVTEFWVGVRWQFRVLKFARFFICFFEGVVQLFLLLSILPMANPEQPFRQPVSTALACGEDGNDSFPPSDKLPCCISLLPHSLLTHFCAGRGVETTFREPERQLSGGL